MKPLLLIPIIALLALALGSCGQSYSPLDTYIKGHIADTNHICSDTAHTSCDGQCFCDGLECN